MDPQACTKVFSGAIVGMGGINFLVVAMLAYVAGGGLPAGGCVGVRRAGLDFLAHWAREASELRSQLG
jgi:hypothetical protein